METIISKVLKILSFSYLMLRKTRYKPNPLPTI